MHETPLRETSQDPAPPTQAKPEPLALPQAIGNRAMARLVLGRRETVAASKVLRAGSSGEAVFDLQAKLNSVDEVETALEVDGKFGEITRKAVREFQSAHPPLKVDGEVGDQTRPALEAAAAELQEPRKIAEKVFKLGAAAYAARRFGHAYDFFTRADELVPGMPELAFSRAQALRRLGGRRKEAIALFERYLAVPGGRREKDARAFIAELAAPARTGTDADREAARKIFERAAKLYEKGDFAHAADEFERSREVLDLPEIAFSEAQAVRRMGGQRDRAIALYQQYLDKGDGKRGADARGGIDDLRGVKTGDAAADRATGEAAFGKGAAAYQAGKYAVAADRFAKTSDVFPDPAIVFSRAQALRKAGGHRDEAIALYDEYLASAATSRRRDAQFFRDLLAKQGAAP